MMMRSPDLPGAVGVDARRDGLAARRVGVLSGWDEARAVPFFAVPFFAVAFFSGTVHPPRSAVVRLVSLITSLKDVSGKRQLNGTLGLFAPGGDGRS